MIFIRTFTILVIHVYINIDTYIYTQNNGLHTYIHIYIHIHLSRFNMKDIYTQQTKQNQNQNFCTAVARTHLQETCIHVYSHTCVYAMRI